MTPDRIAGGLLGLALGDAFGAPFEGGPLERLVWRGLGRTRTGKRRFTDDTTMSLDLAESLSGRCELDLDDLARRFGESYRWSRGYGPGAAKLLKRIRQGADWREASRSVFPEGSFGNGGAMRAPVIGLAFCGDLEALAEAASEQASVTHAHPLAREGAVLIAVATSLALGEGGDTEILEGTAAHARSDPYLERLAVAGTWLHEKSRPPIALICERLGNGIAATESCATALYLGLRFLEEPFEALLAEAARLGGDVDTLSAMAGALWGARNGAAALPARMLERLEQRERIETAAAALAKQRPPPP